MTFNVLLQAAELGMHSYVNFPMVPNNCKLVIPSRQILVLLTLTRRTFDSTPRYALLYQLFTSQVEMHLFEGLDEWHFTDEVKGNEEEENNHNTRVLNPRPRIQEACALPLCYVLSVNLTFNVSHVQPPIRLDLFKTEMNCVSFINLVLVWITVFHPYCHSETVLAT